MTDQPISLTSLTDEQITDAEGLSDSSEENENPLLRHQCNSQESILIPHIPISEEICIAPCDGKKPNSFLADENYEVLVFPYLLLTGKFGHNIQQRYKSSPLKYFNQRLLIY